MIHDHLSNDNCKHFMKEHQTKHAVEEYDALSNLTQKLKVASWHLRNWQFYITLPTSIFKRFVYPCIGVLYDWVIIYSRQLKGLNCWTLKKVYFYGMVVSSDETNVTNG